MRARDQSSIFSTGGKFCPDYGLLLELHALTLVARSYALLTYVPSHYRRLELAAVSKAMPTLKVSPWKKIRQLSPGMYVVHGQLQSEREKCVASTI